MLHSEILHREVTVRAGLWSWRKIVPGKKENRWHLELRTQQNPELWICCYSWGIKNSLIVEKRTASRVGGGGIGSEQREDWKVHSGPAFGKVRIAWQMLWLYHISKWGLLKVINKGVTWFDLHFRKIVLNMESTLGEGGLGPERG